MLAYTTYDASYRPNVRLGEESASSLPLVIVNVIDLRTGKHHAVDDVGMATDFNTPVWWSNEEILIRRVGH